MLDSVHIDEFRFETIPGREGKLREHSTTDSVFRYSADSAFSFRVRQRHFGADTSTAEVDGYVKRFARVDSAFARHIHVRKPVSDTSTELKVVSYDERGRMVSELRSYFFGRFRNQRVFRLELTYWNDSLVRSVTSRDEDSRKGGLDSQKTITTYEYMFSPDSSRILSVRERTERRRESSTSIFRYSYLPNGKLMIERYSDNSLKMHWSSDPNSRVRVIPPVFTQNLESWTFTSHEGGISKIKFDSKVIRHSFPPDTTLGRSHEINFGCKGGKPQTSRRQ